jgi:hypothetical protein
VNVHAFGGWGASRGGQGAVYRRFRGCENMANGVRDGMRRFLRAVCCRRTDGCGRGQQLVEALVKGDVLTCVLCDRCTDVSGVWWSSRRSREAGR